MTTMDSDSASQDSDEGRRFRFETTRKDANSRYETSRGRRSSPRERERPRRSRSRDRSRQRRDESRSRDRKRGSREEREREKPVSHRGSSPKHRRDERNYERRHSHERRERIHRRSRDSRESEKKRRRGIEDKTSDAPEVEKKKLDREKIDRERIERDRIDNDKDDKDKQERIDDSRSLQDCKDLNLSDFDIVSDTAEHSSDESRGSDDAKRKVSSRHYERLLEKKAATKRRRSVEENIEKTEDSNDASENGNEPEVNGSSWGPALPPVGTSETSRDIEKKEKKIIGPVMPDFFRSSNQEEEEEEDDSAFGPALPPHLTANKTSHVENLEEEKMEIEKSPPESDDDFLGPLPLDHPALQNDLVQKQLEMRARRLKAEIAACDQEEEKKREEWMTELPPEKTVSLGLGPRKFRVRPGPDMSDRSSWTDTPADKARKRIEKLENRNNEPTISSEGRRKEESEEREKSRKKEKSLMEIHQKKMHKKKKKEERQAKKSGKTTERRPFDRDIDLQANRFDEARKKSILFNASKLDDRFARGKI